MMILLIASAMSVRAYVEWRPGVLADRCGWDGVLWFYAGSAVVDVALLGTIWRVRVPR